jgi:Zn-dependent protease with chaperone function
VGFVGLNVERVPATGRYRFNCVSAATEEALSDGQYREIMQQFRGRVLPAGHPATRMVRRVLDRLVVESGVQADWEVNVIEDEGQINAFVLPGWVGLFGSGGWMGVGWAEDCGWMADGGQRQGVCFQRHLAHLQGR